MSVWIWLSRTQRKLFIKKHPDLNYIHIVANKKRIFSANSSEQIELSVENYSQHFESVLRNWNLFEWWNLWYFCGILWNRLNFEITNVHYMSNKFILFRNKRNIHPIEATMEDEKGKMYFQWNSKVENDWEKCEPNRIENFAKREWKKKKIISRMGSKIADSALNKCIMLHILFNDFRFIFVE